MFYKKNRFFNKMCHNSEFFKGKWSGWASLWPIAVFLFKNMIKRQTPDLQPKF